MGLYLNPGNEGFKISVSSEIYVDKTDMISFTNNRLGQEKRFLCVSRPRRFGKSMAANMLSAYYDRTCDSRELFKNLNIEKHTSYSEHLNQYDVIFLNMQQLLSGAGSVEKFIDYIQKTVIEELKEDYGEYFANEESHLPVVLANIFAKDTRTKKGFVFIIDEWDCVFREYKENKDGQRKYLDFLKDLLKDRSYVKLAYMTGILPVKKYGTHSALNIFDEFSMLDPKRMAEYVGFTEDEVKNLCAIYNMDFEQTKFWYDGYMFKRVEHIYNPKSIVDAMLEEEFKSYWTGTESYDALKIYIEMNFDGLKDAIISMLGGEQIRVNTRSFQNDMTTFSSKDEVFTLLVHLGYLAYNEQTQEVFIPNMEVMEEFKNTIEGTRGWEQIAGAITKSEDLLDKTLKMDTDAVAKGMDKVHMEHTSVLAYNNENSLSCVITLAYFSARKDYVLIREFPTGKGFADIVFIPRKNVDKPAIIIELKWDKSKFGAIEQIKHKEYVASLDGYSGDILLVGINYDKNKKKHECAIEKYRC
jgi:hypothetical protein